MPTIIKIDGWRFSIFMNEGPRAHVHATKGGATAKVWLDTMDLAKGIGLTRADERRIIKLVRLNEEILREAWDEYISGR